MTILSIADIGNDQGRQVRINFTGSTFDVYGSPTPIIQYEAYRRIDELPSRVSARHGEIDQPMTRISEQGAFLEGWEFVGAIPAHGESLYNMVAPTLADSTKMKGMHWSVFFIRAATEYPVVFYDSPIDSGYSLDNLPPGPPLGLSVSLGPAGQNLLSWDPQYEEDLESFRIYRSNGPDFVPTSQNLIHSTEETEWTDPVTAGYQYFYRITARDEAGNESDPSSSSTSGTATGIVRGTGVPLGFSLYQNVPNPFNPTTVIRYDVPAGGGLVTLRVYDIAGRIVRTLVDGVHTPGSVEVTWDGRDASGGPVASGVYFYRLVAPGYGETKKMVLLK